MTHITYLISSPHQSKFEFLGLKKKKKRRRKLPTIQYSVSCLNDWTYLFLDVIWLFGRTTLFFVFFLMYKCNESDPSKFKPHSVHLVKLILLFSLFLLLFMGSTTLLLLFMGLIVLFQLTFTFIYSTFSKKFSVLVK